MKGRIRSLILIMFILIVGCTENSVVGPIEQIDSRFSSIYVAPYEIGEFEEFKSIFNSDTLKKLRNPRYMGPPIKILNFIDKISITGWENQHTIDIRTAFKMGYVSAFGFEFNGIIDAANMSGAITPVYEFNEGYEALIHSYVTPVDYMSYRVLVPGGEHYVEGLDKFIVFQASGSNSFIHVTRWIEMKEITANHYVTGAGIDHNQTGYAIEFFDKDPIYNSASSFSNGYIGGKVIAIYNFALLFHNDLTLTELKAAVIKTSTLHGELDLYDGYGKIKVYAALWELWKTRRF